MNWNINVIVVLAQHIVAFNRKIFFFSFPFFLPLQPTIRRHDEFLSQSVATAGRSYKPMNCLHWKRLWMKVFNAAVDNFVFFFFHFIRGIKLFLIYQCFVQQIMKDFEVAKNLKELSGVLGCWNSWLNEVQIYSILVSNQLGI